MLQLLNTVFSDSDPGSTLLSVRFLKSYVTSTHEHKPPRTEQKRRERREAGHQHRDPLKRHHSNLNLTLQTTAVKQTQHLQQPNTASLACTCIQNYSASATAHHRDMGYVTGPSGHLHEPVARWLAPRFGIPSHNYCTVHRPTGSHMLCFLVPVDITGGPDGNYYRWCSKVGWHYISGRKIALLVKPHVLRGLTIAACQQQVTKQ
jgi:hypothetical protein